ncbi:CobW family GTP-binding protein [Pseudomonas sp.]|uniref:CobW family GTP-binding protein n=1 Tax=Pseudomonas sp. TaxID=306 RepID=UPI003A9720A5
MNSAPSIPVTVVAGFLGAGKTTLLRQMVQRVDSGRLAVIVNDFGELNIDAAIIAEVTDAVYSLQNGCICCTVQEDLLAQLVSLSRLRPAPERIIIECSGVSDPQRIVQTIAYPQLRTSLHLDAVITLVDASSHHNLDVEMARLSRAQVASADWLLLNKVDLVTPEQLHNIRIGLGSRVPVFETVRAELPPELLLAPLVRSSEVLFKLLPQAHDQLFESWVWSSVRPLQPTALRAWLARLPADLLRLKGLVHLDGSEQPYWLQHVGKRSQFIPAANQPSEYAAQLVFIARRGSDLRQRLEAGIKGTQAP